MLHPPSPPTDFRPDSPAMLQYHADMTQYVNAKEEERLCQIPLILIDNTEGWPATLHGGPQAKRKTCKPAWGKHDLDHEKEATPRRERAVRPCMDCGGIRVKKKARCFECDLKAQEREQVRNHKRKR